MIQANINGTWALLEAARELGLPRFHQISTDEVYGQIPEPGRSKEADVFEPRSPYSASKAAAEHIVYAYHITYGLNTTITRGSNNIGPFHYPEKAVPLFTTNAMDDIAIPIYGDGMQMRDYQYVTDHCEGIDVVLHRGVAGEAYNVGTSVETRNIDMAHKILDLLGKPRSLITYVKDRAGHDRRYALDTDKLRALGWKSGHTFDQALEKTVKWYVDNPAWWPYQERRISRLLSQTICKSPRLVLNYSYDRRKQMMFPPVVLFRLTLTKKTNEIIFHKTFALIRLNR